MNIPLQNINALWAYLIIEELIRQGSDYFCISPGSRSTPLTTAVARHPKAQKIIIYDERSAGFHALGYGRATGKPAVLICTSGTAPANYLPAVIEAAQDNVPLIILSADRPPELRDSGANQTIDQIKLFGRYVRSFFDMPTPSTSLSPRFVLKRIDWLVEQASAHPAGPVHLNCMFREPLAPEKVPVDPQYVQTVKTWSHAKTPLSQSILGRFGQNKATEAILKESLLEARRGLIVVGRQKEGAPKQSLAKCLRTLGWPVFADITSGLRLGYDWPSLIPHFDLLLNGRDLQFDTVIQLGGRYVSKRLLQLLEKHPPQRHLHITDENQHIDPAQTVTHRLHLTNEAFCALLAELPLPLPGAKQTGAFRKLSDRIERLLANKTDTGPLNQPGISRLIARLLPEGHGLFLANSLSVREMDMFAQREQKPVLVAANRATSGIDGNISTAAGFAAGLGRPVTLLIGDLAFLHDLNALSFVSRLKTPLVIVLINNRGGGIFHYLPIAKFDDIFDPYFATPHEFEFSHAAHQFGIAYQNPQTLADFANAYRQALLTGSPALIEIRTDRRANWALYRDILNAVQSVTE